MAVSNHKILLTKEGFKKLKEELKKREGEVRSKLQDTLNQMRNQGDLKENDGYSIAVEDFQNNEEKINEIKKTLEKAEIVSKKSSTTIDIGSKVTVLCEGEKAKTFNIVGEDEANPLEAKISYKSPLGSSLMGKKKGNKISIETPAGKSTCEILSVE
jgi:transcription elongation factor GreA